MNFKIFTIDSEYKSACRLGFPTYTYLVDNVESFAKQVIIRWGNSSLLYNKHDEPEDFKHVINPARTISLNCNKKEALEKLSKVVKTPTIYHKEVPANQLAVVRPVSHSGGRGFCVWKGPLLIDEGKYATEFLKTDVEYRVWFCGQQTICAKRVTKNKDLPEFPCRSNWNYRFRQITKALHEQTLRAAQIIGLQVGAADVLFYEGQYYFLELNSAPTLDAKPIISFYKKNLLKLIKNV